MQSLDRHLIQRILLIYLIILAVVTLSATLSQAARLTDEVLASGMPLQQFGLLLLTIVPKMMELVTPLSFGLAVILACVQRNEARTTLLMRAAGRSPARDTAVVAGVAAGLAVVLGAASSTLVPANQALYRTLFGQAQQQGIDQFNLPVGQPFELDAFVSLQIEQHDGDGQFSGVSLVEQRSDPALTRILQARTATLRLDPTQRQATLSLDQGMLVEIGPDGRIRQSLRFDQTQVPLSLPPSLLPGLSRGVGFGIDRADTRSSLRLWRQREDRAAAEELVRRLVPLVSMLSFAILAAGALFSRTALPAGQTPLAVFLVSVLIVFLLAQTSLLSAPGFGLGAALTVLLIALAPLSVLPMIRLGQRALP